MLLFFQYYTHCTILEWFVLCCERTDGEVASSYTLMSRDVVKKGEVPLSLMREHIMIQAD